MQMQYYYELVGWYYKYAAAYPGVKKETKKK